MKNVLIDLCKEMEARLAYLEEEVKEKDDKITLLEEMVAKSRIDEITLAIVRVQQLILRSTGYPFPMENHSEQLQLKDYGFTVHETKEVRLNLHEPPFSLFQD